MVKNVPTENSDVTTIIKTVNKPNNRASNNDTQSEDIFTAEIKPGNDVKVIKREPSETGEQKMPAFQNKKRIAAYCRVSTDKEEQESSLHEQIDSFRRQAEEHTDWEIIDVYVDEGISGTQVHKRDAFNRMIADCEAGKIDYILTKSISRFARNTLECLSFVRHLKEYNVYVYFEKEHMDTKTEASEMVLSILAAIAQEESRNISENIKWNQRKRYREGKALWSKVYGYKKEGGREYIIDEETAPTIRRIFNDYVHGKTAKKIAEELEAEAVPGPKGCSWTYGTVDFIVTNEKYCGDVLCQKSYVEDHITHKRKRNNQTVVPGYYIRGHHTPIVDRKTFELARTIRSVRSRKGKPVQYPYGGFITCPVCGNKMVRIVLERTHSPAVWRCDPVNGVAPCTGSYIAESYINDALRRAYAGLTPEALKKQAEKKNSKFMQAANEALKMKEEMPELTEIHYYFLDIMVNNITFNKKRNIMKIHWKCGLKSSIPITYKTGTDVPGSEKQLSTRISKRWAEAAAKAANKADNYIETR